MDKKSYAYVLICGEGEIVATYLNYYTAYNKMVELEKKRYIKEPHYYIKMKKKYYPDCLGMTTDILEFLIDRAYYLGNTYYDIIPTTLWED